MKEVTCPKCQKKTPNYPAGCRWCGSSLVSKGKLFMVAVAGAILIPVVLANCNQSSSTGTVGLSPTQNMSYILGEQEKIKGRLKDPASAEFRNVFVSSSYAVCGEVNAKNSFGGYSGYVRFISGSDMQVIESDMAAGEMDKTWPQICKR